MILTPYQYNGTSLQSSPYQASFFPREQADLQIKSQPGYIKRAGAVPVYAGKDFMPHTLNLQVLVSSSPSYMTNFESLNQLFDTKDETPRQFICIDTEDSDKQYYVYATPQQVLGGHEGNMAVVTLALDDPIWQSVTENSQDWTITSSTSTTDVTNNGNDYAYPVFEITPTSSPTTDFVHTMHLQILPTSANPWTARPLCVTGATDTTWDTAALIAGGKMQASSDPGGAGGDIRVYRNGAPIDFWVSGINTTDTKVWVVTDMPEQRNMVLKTAIGATDTVTTMDITYDRNNLYAFNACPLSGKLIVDTSLGSTDSEEFWYSGKVAGDDSIQFTISRRAARSTTAVAHAAGSNVRFLPYGFAIKYGNLTTTSAEVDDTTKPVLNLSTSNNASFVYSSFYDLAGLRAGIWKPRIRAQSDPLFSRSGIFTSTSDEGDTDPATEMGLSARTYQASGLQRPDSVVIDWIGYFPDYVTSFSASGEQNQTASTIPTFGMTYAIVNIERENFWTVSAQATTDYGTWTAWTKATTDAAVPPNVDALIWKANGTILGASDLYAKAGISAATVNLTNNPHVMMRSEVSGTVNINCRITNATTGGYITVFLPVEVNDTLIVDTDPSFPTATYNGQIVNSAVKLSTIRSAWLRLAPGSNTLNFDNLNSLSNNFTIVVKWNQRANFF